MKTKYAFFYLCAFIFGTLIFISCGDEGEEPVISTEVNTLRYLLKEPGFTEKRVTGIAPNAISSNLYIGASPSIFDTLEKVLIIAESSAKDSIYIEMNIRKDTLSKSRIMAFKYFPKKIDHSDVWYFSRGSSPHQDTSARLKIYSYDQSTSATKKINGSYSVLLRNEGRIPTGYTTMTGVFEDIQLKYGIF